MSEMVLTILMKYARRMDHYTRLRCADRHKGIQSIGMASHVSDRVKSQLTVREEN